MKSLIAALSLVLLLVSAACPKAEIFVYTDGHGRKHITDDPSRIPDGEGVRTRVVPQKSDSLSAEEKRAAREKEAEEAGRRTAETAERLRIEEELRRSSTASQAEATSPALTTQVVIRGNQVLVPTRISHGGGEIEVMLLLDTGASLTTVSRGVADRLGLAEEEKMSARVAGGGVIRFHTGRVETLRIGTLRMRNVMVGIIDEKGPAGGHDGLLGMNVLRNFRYSVDYQNASIRWEP
jgi:predicted aspartyl protease